MNIHKTIFSFPLFTILQKYILEIDMAQLIQIFLKFLYNIQMEPEQSKPIITKQEVKPIKTKQQNEIKEKLEKLLLRNSDKNKEIKQHMFWKTQPMFTQDNKSIQHGPVSQINKVQQISKEPYKLPQGFEWCQIDLNNQIQLSEFYTLLLENYVEDEGSSFRFQYSKQFLKWALMPPNYQKSWIIGVRMLKKLIASITGIPVHLHAENDKIKMGQINFLCVHKTIRDHRLAPILIKQVTRRINIKNKWQAIYTAGKLLPTPFTQTTYWHRSLNPKKLIEVRFSGLGQNQTVARLQKLYKLPEETDIVGLRPMVKKDVSVVTKLINEGLQKYVVKFKFSEDEVRHFFLPRNQVIYSYVVENNKKITDFISFYYLPSQIMKHQKHKLLKACYSFYNFANSMNLERLIYNALILANKQDFDVFNCLDIMQNQCFLKELMFNVGDGHLNYYIYNWILERKKILPSQLGVVLV